MSTTKPKSITELYDGIATRYQINRHKATNDVIEFPVVLRMAGHIKGKNVLDIGCGLGKHAKAFLDKGAIVVGIDASREMIKIAKQTCGNKALFIKKNFEDAKFKPKSFDLLNASFSLHYSNRLNYIFKKFNTWLKPGGKMLFTIYHPMQYYLKTKDFDYSKSKKLWIKLRSYDVEVFNYYHPLNDYIRAIVNNNFIILSILDLVVPKNIKGWTNDKYRIPSGLLFEIEKK